MDARRCQTPPLEAGVMPDVLVYQTSDARFADKAVEALARAGIDSFRTGSGYVDLCSAVRHDLSLGVCIYIRRQEDYRRANELLRDLGAVVDEPVKLPSRRVSFLLAFFAVLIALVVTLNWR